MASLANVLRSGDLTSIAGVRSALGDISKAFFAERAGASNIVEEARNWQTGRAYHVSDPYDFELLGQGKRLEAGFPGLSNYAVDGGTAAAQGGDARSVWEGVQVGPGEAGGAHAGYRSSMVELHVNTETPSASGITQANSQFGAGGTKQYFLDIRGGIAHGDIAVLDHAGHPIHIPAGTTPREVESVLNQALHGSGTIHLTGADAPDFRHVMSMENAGRGAGIRIVLRGIGYAGTNVVGAR